MERFPKVSEAGTGASAFIKNPPRCGGLFRPHLGKYATGNPSVAMVQDNLLEYSTDPPISPSLLNLGRVEFPLKASHLSRTPTAGTPTPAAVKCHLCSRVFKSIRARASHLTFCRRKLMRQSSDVFPCDLCDRDFSSIHGMRIHRAQCVKKSALPLSQPVYVSHPPSKRGVPQFSSQPCPSIGIFSIGDVTRAISEDEGVVSNLNDYGSVTQRKTMASVTECSDQTRIQTTVSGDANINDFQREVAPSPEFHPPHHISPLPPPLTVSPHTHAPVSDSRSSVNSDVDPIRSSPASSKLKDIDIDFLITHSRKAVDWDQAQTAKESEKCEAGDSFVIKDRLEVPSTSEEWKQLDEVISAKFDSTDVLDVSQDSDFIDDAALRTLKDIVYSCIYESHGSKSSFPSVFKKKKKKLRNEMTELRKKKKEASKEFKRLRREGADDDELKEQKRDWKKLIRVHNKVRIQEEELQNKLTEVRNNTEFVKDPFKFIRKEVTKGTTNQSTPSCSKEAAVDFFKERYSDPGRAVKIPFPEFLDIPDSPKHPLKSDVPAKEHFERYILARRNKSAPGPDGIPFIVYKKCPTVRARLIQILRRLWKAGRVAQDDRCAIKILLAKTSSSRELKDYRDITLFNASLKALTGTWARFITDFMVKNKYLDTTIQKGFVPRVAGCVEHNQTMVDLLKESRKEKSPFQLAFLDLENAFGSCKHNLILAALRFYNVPVEWVNLIQSLYDECHVVVTTRDWTTPPIQIQKGSLQGGPEASTLFNIPWNLFISGLFRFMTVTLSYKHVEKPVSGFADDLTVKTRKIEDMCATLKFAEELCVWSRCFKFKESKSAIMALDEKGVPFDPKCRLNDILIPPLTTKPFKFLGRWVYPSLKDKELVESAVKKVDNLMKKTDSLLLDGRKKVWIYQHGIIPYLCWDFSMVEVNDTAIARMEAIVNRYLKKWLKLTRSADCSILYRKDFGLNITSIKNAVISNRCNTEILLCTSRDPLVRSTAKRRRDSAQLVVGQNNPKRIKVAVRDLEFQKAFCQHTRSDNDHRGFGSPGAGKKVNVNKKTIVNRVKELTDEEKIGKIMSLSVQSNWTQWDDFIRVDFGWNEMMYGMSPSLLSFWLNSVQNTLPDPTNLRRWGKQSTASCSLCKWKGCTLQHIICSCKVALEQGRISYRHDSILHCIVKYIKSVMVEQKSSCANQVADADKQSRGPIRFVKQGTVVKKRKRKKVSYWGNHTDWKILMDTRTKQYQIPSCIASSSLRPDICVYSEEAKRVCFIELTSPAEENVKLWKIRKTTKYIDLVSEAKSNGFTACCRTVEVGARGFVSESSMNVFTLLGFSNKKRKQLTKEMSRTAIRCSHFIWINRDNPQWGNPSRAV